MSEGPSDDEEEDSSALALATTAAGTITGSGSGASTWMGVLSSSDDDQRSIAFCFFPSSGIASSDNYRRSIAFCFFPSSGTASLPPEEERENLLFTESRSASASSSSNTPGPSKFPVWVAFLSGKGWTSSLWTSSLL